MAALPLLVLLSAASPSLPPLPSASLRVDVEGLRDHKGMLRFCLTRHPNYMECDGDKAAIRLSVAASMHEVTFNNMTPGEWSLLLIHDSNSNGKLDKRFGIPREGFGFSGNPAIRFGPPSAKDVHFEVPAGPSQQNIKMRYIF